MTFQPRRAAALAAATLALVTAGLAVAGASSASASSTAPALNGYESDLLTRANDARTGVGAGALTIEAGLTDLARSWAASEASRGVLAHNPDLGTQLQDSGAARWSTAAENVARGGPSSAVFSTYLGSAAHKANILRTDTAEVGIGAARAADGTIYDVMVFADVYDVAYGASRTTPQAIDASGQAPAAPAPTTTAPTTAPIATTKPAPTTAPVATTKPAPTTKPVPTTTPAPTTKPAPPRVPVGAVTGLAGRCLDVRSSSSADGTAAVIFRCNGSASQRWSVTTAGTLSALGKCLDVRGGARSNGTPVQLYACNGTAAQQWVAGPQGSVRNPVSGLCLDVPLALRANGVALQIWPCNGTVAQRWTLPA